MLDLTKLFSCSRDLGFITDPRGAVLAATAGAERALGYASSELLGLDLPRLDETGDLQRFFEVTPVRSRMNLGFHLRTKAGALLTVGALATSLRDEAGNPVGWFIAGQDLRGAVSEARGGQPILDALLDSIGAALWSFDRNGTVITWGRACESAFGLSRAEVEGKLSVVRLFPSPEEYRRVLDVVDRAGQFSGELELIDRDGLARPNHLSVTPLVAGGLSVGYTCVSLDVAEHKRVEEFQRILFEQAGEAILVVDAASLRVLEANAKAWEIHGYTRDEFLSLHAQEIADPSGRPDVNEVLRALRETGHYEGDRHVHRRKDGSTFPCAINLREVPVGGRGTIIAVVRDLTAQRKAEEFQRVLFEQAGEAILVIEHGSRRIIEANSRAWEMHGYTREEFLRLRVEDLLPPEGLPRMQEIGRALQEQGRYETEEQVHRRKDGSLFPIALNLRMASIGERRLVVAVYRDLTEQRKAEEFLRVLFDKAVDAVYLVEDEELRIVEANGATCRLLGYTREELLKLRVVDLVPPPYRHRIAEYRESVRKEPGYRRDRRVLYRKDGSVVATDHAVFRVEISKKPYYIASCRDLTEQDRAARELEEAKAFLEHVQENASDGLALLDENGVYVAVNRKLLEIRGETREELLGKTWMDRSNPERWEEYRRYWDRLLKGERVSMRTTIERSGAPAVIVDVSSALILRAEKKFVFAIIRDVTDQVKAEEELRRSREDLERHVAERTAQLRESEERFRGAFTQGGIGMALVSPDGRILQVNRSLCEMLGYDEPDLLATSFQELTHPDDREKSAGLFRRMVQEGPSSARQEKRYLHRQGRVVWADLSSTLIRDAAGAPLYFITSIQDITERKRTEDELRDSEGRFRTIVEATPSPVTITRPDGEIVYVNKAAERLFRLGPNGTVGRSAADFWANPEERAVVRERILKEGSLSDYEIRFRRPDGTVFWTVVNITLLNFQGAPAIFGSYVDIDERKRAEEALRKAHEELEGRVVERTAELARTNALLEEEIADRKRAENTLRLILQGTAAVTGGSFFRSLARHLASALNVGFATVVQVLNQPAGQARTIAFWDGTEFAPPLHYTLAGTPCEDVVGGEACSYAHDVQRLFPDDRLLAELGIESYLGVPMMDSSGSVVGLLSVMDVKPVSDEELKLSVLKIFASRAGVELERQLAEEALRESEERWRSLVANAPDIILTVDREGRILSINRTVTGARLEDVLGRRVHEFVPPDKVGTVQNALDTAFLEGKSTSYETQSLGPQGRKAWYITRVGPVQVGGEVVGATFIATDITDRWKAEQRQKVQYEVTQVLAEAASPEQALPRILERIGAGLGWQLGLLWKGDPDAGVLRLVEAWHVPGPVYEEFAQASRRLTFAAGVGLPGLVWQTRAPLWVEDVQRDSRFVRIRAAEAAGLHASLVLPVEGAQSGFGIIEFFSEEVRAPEEPLVQMASILGSQIGQFFERKRAEEDLRFQKSLLESQSEAAIDGILVVSRDGLMTSFNRRFCQMWDIPDEVIRSRTDERALQSVLDKLVDPNEFLGRVRYLYEHPDDESRDEIHLKDGRAFDRYSAPVKGTDGVLYGRVWYFRDVTGRKQTEENLRRAAEETRRMYEDLKEAQAQLIRSEKLASIGMLVSGVAHEINNPLNVMYGNLQLLAEVSDVLLPLSLEGAKAKRLRGTASRVAKFRGMIRDALKAARHAREIVQDFRNFARDTRTAELVDLNECLEEAVTLIQRELRPGIRVVRKLGRIPQVRCLRGQISQVFLNLLKNAGEAIEKKGTVTLRTQQKDGHVRVEVGDSGRGMAEEVRRKLFEPFFTTKPVGKGLGLGLSISAMIIQNHNGRITVQSRPGRGSVFRVELPVHP